MRTLSVLLLPLLAAGADAGDMPRGVPPTINLVRLNKKGELVMLVIIPVTREVLEKRSEDRGGKKVEVEVRKLVTETMVRQQTVDARGMQASEVGGKKIDPKKLPTLLAKQTPVLISSDGKPINPIYLKLFKKDTLILTFPRPAAPPAPPVPPESEKKPPPPRD
jgi:hypothetical protein